MQHPQRWLSAEGVIRHILVSRPSLQIQEYGVAVALQTCALDAVIFKLDGTYLEIRLKHSALPEFNVDNRSTVDALLKKWSIAKSDKWTIVRSLPDIHMVVTRWPAPFQLPVYCRR